MIIRTLIRNAFSTKPNYTLMNSLVKSFIEQKKAGTPEIKAFQNQLEQLKPLTDQEKDTFYRACISMSKNSTIPYFLKSEGLLTKLPSLHIACNTHHIINTIKEIKDKEKLLKQTQALIQQINDQNQQLSSRCFVEEAFGDIYLPQGKFKQAIQHYLNALKIGNKYFDIIKKQADAKEDELSQDKSQNKKVNSPLMVAMGISQTLAQLSTKALFANSKINIPEYSAKILELAFHPFNQFHQLKFQLPSYFLLKKSEFNHRVIDNKQHGQQIQNDIINAMEQVLQCLQLIRDKSSIQQLQLLGVTAINYASILNFLTGVKGQKGENNILEVIKTLGVGMKDQKKAAQFQKSLISIAKDMKVIK